MFTHVLRISRLLLLLVLLAGVNVLPAMATTETTATFGDQNSSLEYRIKSTYDGTSGVVIFASDTGIKYPYERYTTANTNNTLLAAETGKMITDTGGSNNGAMAAGQGCSKHILPTAAPGMVFAFATGAKCFMTVDTVDTNDTIEYSISGTLLDAGDSIKSTGQNGDSVVLFSTVANKWSIREMHGVWTDNSTN